ncbi:hypothetical protein M758_UG258300 [Ceratodon purpureus]|nr:hypothetical protein M758_UG258300 [Ceratodon purpureus]
MEADPRGSSSGPSTNVTTSPGVTSLSSSPVTRSGSHPPPGPAPLIPAPPPVPDPPASPGPASSVSAGPRIPPDSPAFGHASPVIQHPPPALATSPDASLSPRSRSLALSLTPALANPVGTLNEPQLALDEDISKDASSRLPSRPESPRIRSPSPSGEAGLPLAAQSPPEPTVTASLAPLPPVSPFPPPSSLSPSEVAPAPA